MWGRGLVLGLGVGDSGDGTRAGMDWVSFPCDLILKKL